MGFKQVILFDFWLNLIYTHSNTDKASHWVQHDEVDKVNENLLEFLQCDS
jgi:hypothetical protein